MKTSIIYRQMSTANYEQKFDLLLYVYFKIINFVKIIL